MQPSYRTQYRYVDQSCNPCSCFEQGIVHAWLKLQCKLTQKVAQFWVEINTADAKDGGLPDYRAQFMRSFA